MKHVSLTTFLLGACLGAALLLPPLAAAYDIVPARVRLSYEELRLSDDENMGLFGGGYAFEAKGPLEAGLAIYGAARGRRGGFFTGGAALELHQRLFGRFFFDAGAFAGAGGGGSAPQGGGFMLRGHAGLSLDFDDRTVGLGYGAVDFPNGNISSEQFVVSMSHPFSVLLRDGWGEGGDIDVEAMVPGTFHEPQVQNFDAILMIAAPFDGTRNTEGEVQDGGMAMIGVAWERTFSEVGFLELSVAGSMGGASDGYAQGLCDVGARIGLGSSLAMVVGGGIGLAGGGRVDTGGGVIADASLKLEQAIGRSYHIGAGAGIVGAFDGDFLASRLHVDLGHAFETPVPTGGWRVPGSQLYRARNMRLRLAHQTESPAAGSLRKGGIPDRTINLAGLKGDLMLSPALLMTGQVLAAYDGGAGGYAEGLAGFGLEWPPRHRSDLAVGLEALVGAAGGGGITVEDGLIGQATAGVGYRLGGATGFWLRYGRNGALQRSLDRNVFAVEFSFRFSTLMR